MNAKSNNYLVLDVETLNAICLQTKHSARKKPTVDAWNQLVAQSQTTFLAANMVNGDFEEMKRIITSVTGIKNAQKVSRRKGETDEQFQLRKNNPDYADAVSTNSLKRIFGKISCKGSLSVSTLNVIAKFLGANDWYDYVNRREEILSKIKMYDRDEYLSSSLVNSSEKTQGRNIVLSSNVPRDSKVTVHYDGDKGDYIVLRKLNTNLYMVVAVSRSAILQVGDVMTIYSFIEHERITAYDLRTSGVVEPRSSVYISSQKIKDIKVIGEIW